MKEVKVGVKMLFKKCYLFRLWAELENSMRAKLEPKRLSDMAACTSNMLVKNGQN
jgi:hypothetical protein